MWGKNKENADYTLRMENKRSELLQIQELLKRWGGRAGENLRRGAKEGGREEKERVFFPSLSPPLPRQPPLPLPTRHPPQTPKPPNQSLVTRLLLLLAEQRPQRDAGHLDDLEPDTGDVADGVAAAAETRDEDLVLLID